MPRLVLLSPSLLQDVLNDKFQEYFAQFKRPQDVLIPSDCKDNKDNKNGSETYVEL